MSRRDVGVFAARRYRLSSHRSAVTMFAFATADMAWQDGRLRVRFTHGPDHHETVLWLSQHPEGSLITLECWAPLPLGPGETRAQWNAMKLNVRIDDCDAEGFVGIQDRAQASRPGVFKVFRSTPPSEQGIVSFSPKASA